MTPPAQNKTQWRRLLPIPVCMTFSAILPFYNIRKNAPFRCYNLLAVTPCFLSDKSNISFPRDMRAIEKFSLQRIGINIHRLQDALIHPVPSNFRTYALE